MKITFNFMSFIGLLLVATFLSTLIVDIKVSEITRSLLFISLGFIWNSYIPVIDVEPIKKEEPKVEDKPDVKSDS